jgi:hypothetical protein
LSDSCRTRGSSVAVRWQSPRERSLAFGALLAVVLGLFLADAAKAPGRQAGGDGAGIGRARTLPSLGAHARRGLAIGDLRCTAPRQPVAAAHVELFGRGHVVIVPAGVGVAPPRVRSGAYVTRGRCRYPIWTSEPTGLVRLGRRGLTLGDLFAVLGQPLSRGRMARWRATVRAYVGGARWRGDPRRIPLRPHAQIVVQAGPPVLRPNSHYHFPAGL